MFYHAAAEITYGSVLLDAFLDSLKILGFAFVIYFALSFLEGKVASLLSKQKKLSPLFGSLAGAIPQCGVSVVASDLYLQSKITAGTLVAVFIACSDEALPVLFSDFSAERFWYPYALLGIKIVFGILFGYLIDWLFRSHMVPEAVDDPSFAHPHGCCGHEIDLDDGHEEKASFWKEHLVHPLLHSLKIFAYSFVISAFFGMLFYLWVGEEAMASFVSQNIYLSPLLSAVVGLIPSCASSLLIAELAGEGILPFGAMVAGLAVNAGLGPITLFRKGHFRDSFLIYLAVFVLGLALGYAFIWVP